MATPFQNINMVIQSATRSSKAFLEATKGEYSDDELDDWIEESFEENNFNEIYKVLFDGLFRLIVDTWIESSLEER